MMHSSNRRDRWRRTAMAERQIPGFGSTPCFGWAWFRAVCSGDRQHHRRSQSCGASSATGRRCCGSLACPRLDLHLLLPSLSPEEARQLFIGVREPKPVQVGRGPCRRLDLRRSVCSRSMEQPVADLVGPGPARPLLAESIPGSSRVTSACISPDRGTASGSCYVPVDSPGPVLVPAEQDTLPATRHRHHEPRGTGDSSRQRTQCRRTASGGEAQLEGPRWRMLRPRCVAVLGLQGLPDGIFADRKPSSVANPNVFGGALLWLLPNPSGLQARYQLPEMSEMFKSPDARRHGDGVNGSANRRPVPSCGL